MRGMLRAYSLVSSVVSGLGLLTLVAGGALYLAAPEKSADIWGQVIAKVASTCPQGPRCETHVEKIAESLVPGRTPIAATSSGRLDPSRAALAAVEPAAPESSIDLLALETRLRYLEGAVPTVAPSASSGKPVPSTMEKLAAWESLRGPLLAFLSVSQPLENTPEALSAVAPIESLAPRISARLKTLSTEWSEFGRRLVEGLSASTVVRLLADDSTISDVKAVALLRRLGAEEAREAVERLARRLPRRAAHLLDGLVPVPRAAGPDGEGQAHPGLDDSNREGKSDG